MIAAGPEGTDTSRARPPSDCEARDDWLFEQDVNAWSSLGYVAAGGVLAVEVVRGRLPRAVGALAGLLALEGVGSVLYHGDASDAAQLVHDAPLVGALGYVAGWHAGRLVGGADRGALLGSVIGVVVATISWAAWPGHTNALVGLAVVTTVVASLLARRRRLPGVWTAPLLVLLAFGLVAWWAGSTPSPLCDEESWVQPHSMWHLLTAVIAIAWVDASQAAVRADGGPRMLRRATDRVIGLLAVGLVLIFYRSVDVVGRGHLVDPRPMLVVANHPNGFVDPVVVTAVLRRLPRFLAKAALWRVVVARPFLSAAGVLPVYRRADGDRPSDNRSVFDACHRELARGSTVGVFPEGTTGDRGGLDRVRSGAARIALGAIPTAPDTVVVPVGMAYEDRVVTRSRLLVMIGEPVVAGDAASHGIDADGEPDRRDVDVLNQLVTESLRSVSPDFADREERDVLRGAARAHLQATAPGDRASFARTEPLARRLATADAATRSRIVDAYRVYATRLHLAGLRDDVPDRPPLRRLFLSVVLLVVMGPFVVAMSLVHLPAVVAVVGATALVRSTATKGTVRLLVGLAALLTTWIVAGIVLADGRDAVVAGVLVAVGGAIALTVWAPLGRAARTLDAWARQRDRVGLAPPVLEARADLVERVEQALGAADDRVTR